MFFGFREKVRGLGMFIDPLRLDESYVLFLQDSAHVCKGVTLQTISEGYGSRLRMFGIITEKSDF